MWKYDKGEHRSKHHWSKLEAGFEGSNKGAIGKCPNDVSLEEASKVLNRGIPLQDDTEGYPKKIYAVYRGVIYEAAYNNFGNEYHAYPWRGDLQGRPCLPGVIIKQLEEQAREEGTEKEFKKWWKKYGQ